MTTRSGVSAVTSLLLVVGILVAPPRVHGVVSTIESPAQAAVELNVVATSTTSAAADGYALRRQDGTRTWSQLFDATRRTLLTSSDDGHVVLDTPDAEFTPLDRTPTTRSVVSTVGKSGASWSYVYDPFNRFYSPLPTTLMAPRYAGSDPVDGSERLLTVIDAATVTWLPDGLRVWTIAAHTFPRTVSGTVHLTLAADDQGRLAWQSDSSRGVTESMSYVAQTVPRPTRTQVIWTTLLAHARVAYALRLGLPLSSVAHEPSSPFPRSPAFGDAGTSRAPSALAVATSPVKSRWAVAGLVVATSDAELFARQAGSVIERVLVHHVRPILRT